MNRRRATARSLILRRLLAERAIHSQEELVRLLAEHGHRVTQATVSRDLMALGAEKVVRQGEERYVLADSPPPARAAERELRRRMKEFVIEIGHSLNNVVLTTPPGAAGSVAVALDRALLPEVLGTLGGDDTVLIVTRRGDGGAGVARRLKELMET